ncbi:MAG: hypothetical protein AB7G10_08580 [Reyranellaceae bacterium]
MTWRAMTADEIVSRPEGQLQGSLLLIVICAATLALVAVIFLALALLALPSVALGGMVMSQFRGTAGVGLLYAIPTVYLVLWALIFTIMTMVRAPATPGLAATGLAIWLGLRLVIAIAGQVLLLSRYSGGPAILLQTVLPIVLSIIGDVILTVGFWVYMRDGARPNAYYRRLIRAG